MQGRGPLPPRRHLPPPAAGRGGAAAGAALSAHLLGGAGHQVGSPAATRVTITTIRQGAVQQLPLHLGQAAERGGGVQGRGVEAEDAVRAGAAEDGGHPHQEVAATHC